MMRLQVPPSRQLHWLHAVPPMRSFGSEHRAPLRRDSPKYFYRHSWNFMVFFAVTMRVIPHNTSKWYS